MKKRSIIAISVALVLGLALALIPMVSLAEKADVPSADPVSVWDGTTVSTELKTDPDGAYLIQSAADLAYFAQSVNGGTNYSGKTVKLTTDIKWNDTTNFDSWTKDTTGLNQWTSIGAWGNDFRGTFDGQGHTVSGLWGVYTGDNQGFFGNAGSGAVIKNLNVTESKLFVHRGSVNSGGNLGFVGVARYNPLTVENVVVDMDFRSETSNAVGGIVGNLHGNGTAATLNLINCVFSGSVTGYGQSGGLVGATGSADKTLNVTNCVMNGSVDTVDGKDGLGGVIGLIRDKATVNVKGTTVTGTVTGPNAGGLIGRTDWSGTPTGTVTVSDSHFGATVSGAGQTGGLIGYLHMGTITVNVSNTLVSGSASATGATCYAGGLVGKTDWANGASHAITVSNSIFANVSTSATEGYAGIVFGNKAGTQTATNVYHITGNPYNNETTLPGATAKTAEELKALDLTAAGLTGWKAVSGEYPVPTALYVPGAKTATVDFAALVELNGKTIAADDFTVNLFKADSAFTPEATAFKTVKNGSDGVADLGSVELAEGTHYFVMKQVKEETKGVTYDESVYNVVITVDAFGNIMSAATAKAGVEAVPTSFKFSNTYTVSASALNLSAKVGLTGRTLKAEEFTLALYKADDANFTVTAADPIKTARNDADGNVYFTEVEEYTAVGTHYYVLKQVNNNVPGVTPELVDYNITVTVTDDNSQLKATPSAVKAGASAASDILYSNVYKVAPAQITPSATVTLSGKALTADLFSYSLYATGMDFKVSGDPIKTVKNAADGAVTLGAITVSEKGTSYYVLKQNAFTADGYTASVTEYCITVTAADSGAGTLSVSYVASKAGESGASDLIFSNSYEKPVVRLEKPADASVYEGTMSEELRTEGNNVYIDSAADLAKFADMVTNGTNFAGKTVVLTTDIVWNATGDAAEWAKGENLPTNTSWQAGTWNKWFVGTFDGQGHTIYGLYGNSGKDNFGFIGAASSGASVKNLILANCAFVVERASGNANLGGVIGTVFAGKVSVDNVYAEVFLSSNCNNVGGILGYSHKTTGTEITISNTVFAGSVTGKDNVAGIAGYLTNAPDDGEKTGTVKLENVLNKGSVTGGSGVAGLVGGNNKQTYVTVTDSVSVGLITGTSNVGAVYGKYDTAAPTVTDAYYLNVSAPGAGTDITATAVTGEKLYGDAAKTNLTGLDFTANWAVVKDDAPMPLSVYNMVNPATGGEGSGDGSGSEETKEPEAVLPTVTPSKDASVYDGTVSKKLRSEDKTIYIDSAADLAKFAENVTNGMGYANKTIVLTTDIIWNKGDADKWADGSATPEYAWTCGKWNKFFQGTFDGNGHVISGLFSTSESDNTGVFGAVSGKATVKNLAVVNSTFIYTGTKNANMGFIGVTGEGTKVTVDNCFVDANFISEKGNQVGGIIGRVHNKGCEATVTNTVFVGSVKGNDAVGGFIGRADCNTAEDAAKVTVENSLNLGTVTGNKNTAGFVGFNNKGTVAVKTSINAGLVTCADAATTGAFFGSGTDNVTLTDCVYVIGTSLKATGADLKEGTVSVAAVSLLGDTAKTTLPKFDFKKEWTAVKNGYPLPTTVVKSFGAGGAENNPATSDFIPAAFAVVCILSAGAALLVLRKKKVN